LHISGGLPVHLKVVSPCKLSEIGAEHMAGMLQTRLYDPASGSWSETKRGRDGRYLLHLQGSTGLHDCRALQHRVSSCFRVQIVGCVVDGRLDRAEIQYLARGRVSPRLCGTNVLNVAWEGREGKLENAAYATQRWGYIRNDIRQSLYKLLCDLSLERLACSRFVLCN